MQEASLITYATYPEYKYIDGFEFLTPLEMPENIIDDIIYTVKGGIKTKLSPGELTDHLKKILDANYGKYWHVFCGKNFGAFSVHDRYRFVFFKYKAMSYLIYKSTY